ncbi:MAG: RNA-directed DNA polymerase [Patescibacteria group bacterium]|jgi:hypothetical protein
MNRSITIEGIPFNIDVLVKQMKCDLKDDWFPDTLIYGDALRADKILGHFMKHNKKPQLKYFPAKSEQYNIPKKGFTLRYSLETTIHDRLLYHGAANYLIRFYDKLLSPSVFSHRWTKKPKNKYMFLNAPSQWTKFEDAAKTKLRKKTDVLLVSDIQNFYENIRISDIQKALIDELPNLCLGKTQVRRIQKTVEIISRLLRAWTPYKKHGIPQNRDASSFLANVLMHRVDKAMVSKGYKYVRYADDMRIVCDSKYSARKILKEVIIELRKIGLNVNAQKTLILHQNTKEIENYIRKPNRKVEQIDQLFKSHRRSTVQQSFPLLKAYALELIRAKKTQAREFRFCIHRLEKIALCKEAKRGFDFKKITRSVIRQLSEQPCSSDSFIRYLKSVDLTPKNLKELVKIMLDREKNIYSWQSYLLWQLFVAHKYSNTKLINLAKQIVKGTKSVPLLSGALLYLGACGSAEDRVYLAKRFKKLKHYITQRNGMIAIHELPYAPHIRDKVQPFVRADIRGTYRALQDASLRGNYFIPLEPINITELYRDLPEYDN